MWKGQIAPLSRAHTLILWDMRGHGQTDSPDDVSLYSEEATVADMAALLDHVGPQDAVIGGLSLGGYMSLAFHRTHPARTKALLIVDTGPGFKNDAAREDWNVYARKSADRFRARWDRPAQIAEQGTRARLAPLRQRLGARGSRHAHATRCAGDRVRCPPSRCRRSSSSAPNGYRVPRKRPITWKRKSPARRRSRSPMRAMR